MLKDLFSSNSENYQRYRPKYPDELFSYLSSLCEEHNLAWDVGTGNGQAALALAPYFEKIFASDGSANQIKYAPAHENISYIISSAEEAFMPALSADLITVAQAFHWFDHKAFLKEVLRVLKPHGVLAIWCYDLCKISPEIDEVIFQLYKNMLGPYWEKEREFVEQGYRHNPFLSNELNSPSFFLEAHWNFEQFKNYLATWSPIKKYKAHKGHDPLEKITPLLCARWGNPENVRHVRWKLFLRVGRK